QRADVPTGSWVVLFVIVVPEAEVAIPLPGPDDVHPLHQGEVRIAAGREGGVGAAAAVAHEPSTSCQAKDDGRGADQAPPVQDRHDEPEQADGNGDEVKIRYPPR